MIARPVVGQDLIIRALENAFEQQRLGHALLFSGPPGSGKKTLARWLAKKLNCEEKPGPCDSCRICGLIDRGNYADLFWLYPEGASIKISQVRAVRERLSLFPCERGVKVCIIEDADLLTGEAANSLLKILEEPPPDVIFIMLTARPSALPTTVLSRCTHFPFRSLDRGEIEELLQQEEGKLPVEADVLSMYSRGVPGKVLEIACSGSWDTRRDEVFALVDLIHAGTVKELIEAAREIASRDDLTEIIDLLIIIYRDRLTWALTGQKDLLFNSDRVEYLMAGDHLPTGLEKSLRVIMKTRGILETGASSQLALEAMFLQLRRVNNYV